MTVRSATQNIPTAHRLAVVLQQLAQIVVGKDEPLGSRSPACSRAATC